MKKIAIITLVDYNIGNRLQNYALQNTLEKIGLDVTTLRYQSAQLRKVEMKDIPRGLLGLVGIKRFQKRYWNLKRKRRYENFNKDKLSMGMNINIDNLDNIVDSYDYYIAGSDQVWHNWKLGKKELEYFYMMFAPTNKRLTYAPSFGFETFPEEDIEIHKQGLLNLKALSCREHDGCDLIKGLVGIEAQQLIDPTFLLDLNTWKMMEKMPKWANEREKYILCYFLGSTTEDYKQYISKYAKKKSCKLIFVYSGSSYNEYSVMPDEFLYLLDKAEFVFTDSFHACAFSLIYEKQFIAFPRVQKNMEGMRGRIDTLFSMLDMNSRWYVDADPEDAIDISYKKIIRDEKEKALNYLKAMTR